MSDIFRRDFRPKHGLRSEGGNANDARPQRFYGFVGHYPVALRREDISPTYGVYQVVMARCGSSTLYPVVTLLASEEGRQRAREIADTVLRTLRMIEASGSER